MSTSNSKGHGRYEEDAGAYVLGALLEQESREFEAHLAGCPSCQQQVAELRGAADMLALSPAPLRPPPEVKQRVMATVRAEAELDAASSAERTAQRRVRRIPSWWPLGTPGFALAGLASAAVVIALGVVALSGGSSSRTYTGIVSAPGASASVRVASYGARLDVHSLPALPANRLWEVWLKRAGQPPVPADALFDKSDGSVALPASLHGVQAVLVTSERRPNGSQAPTRQPTIVVRLA